MTGISSSAQFRKKQRFTLVMITLSVVVLISVLLWQGLGKDSLSLFVQPSHVAERGLKTGTRIRLGGLVVPGSVIIDDVNATARFSVTDCKAEIRVSYANLLPDLFREGQEVVTEGVLMSADVLVADTVLAKHDENYAPPEALIRDKDGCKARQVTIANQLEGQSR